MSDYNFTEKESEVLSLLLETKPVFQSAIYDQHFSTVHINAKSVIINLLRAVKSVEENVKDATDDFIVANTDVHPERFDSINLPTLAGALAGSRIAIDSDGLCYSCAYRKGSRPNQCIDTVNDTQWQAGNREPFYCHIDVGEDEKPTAACKGWALQMREKHE